MMRLQALPCLILQLLLSPAGPGKAWSAKEQGEYLFELSGKKPKFIRAPIGLMDGIISVFDGLARVFPALEVSLGLLHGSNFLTVLVGHWRVSWC